MLERASLECVLFWSAGVPPALKGDQDGRAPRTDPSVNYCRMEVSSPFARKGLPAAGAAWTNLPRRRARKTSPVQFSLAIHGWDFAPPPPPVSVTPLAAIESVHTLP